jgi:hypothetical protein
MRLPALSNNLPFSRYQEGVRYRYYVSQAILGSRPEARNFRRMGNPPMWQTPQRIAAEAAVGRPIYAIDTGKVK